MKKIKIMILRGLVCCACGPITQEQENARAKQYLSEYLVYYKDTKTDTCFAGTEITRLTSVKCNDKVEAKAIIFESK